MRRAGHAVAIAVASVLAGQHLAAQDAGTQPVVQSPILTLDQELLFVDSAWGRRVTAEIESASAELQAENRRIESDLSAEEQSLTERRATMEPEAFRAEADAFDTKVTAIRSAQDAKGRNIAGLRDEERQRFLAAALPVFGEILRERGAVIVMDKRAVFISANAIDVTDEMIARLDVSLGDGSKAPDDPPADPSGTTRDPAPVADQTGND